MWLHSFVENIGPHTSIYKIYMIIVYNKKKKKSGTQIISQLFATIVIRGGGRGSWILQKSSLPLVFLVKIIILDINFINGPLDFYQKNM